MREPNPIRQKVKDDMALLKKLPKTKPRVEPMIITIDNPTGLAKEIEGEALPLAKQTKGVVITSAEEYDLLTKSLLDLSEQAKRLKTAKESVTKPLNEALKNLRAIFSPAEKAVDEAIQSIKAAVLIWNRKVEEDRRQAVLNAQTVAKKSHTLAKHQLAKAPDPVEHVTGISIKEHWVAVVEDPDLVPREWCAPDEKRLNAYAKATKGSVEVPGVRFENVGSVASTPGRRTS